MSDENELLDISDAAQFLNVSETSLRRWTNSGRLPCLRVGQRRERRFRRADLLAFLEGQPSEAGPSFRVTGRARISERPAEQVTVTLGSHLCAFYDSDLGRLRLFVPFLLEGLEAGSVCFLLGAPDVRDAIVTSLKKKRPSLQADIAAGRLILWSYLASPAKQFRYWQKLIDESAAAGAESFRVSGDIWEIRSQLTDQAFADYEAGYDHAVSQKYPVVTLCVYDARKFSGVEVLSALKGHRDTLRYPLERALA